MRIAGYWGQGDEAGAENGLILHSCGHNRLTSGVGINRPYGGQTHLLLYIHKDYEIFQFGGELYRAPPGSVVLYKPGERQRHFYDGAQTAENYYVHFSLPGSRLLESLTLQSSRLYRLAPSGYTVEQFEAILRELQNKAPHYKRVATAQFITLLCGIDRRLRQQSDPGHGAAVQAVSPAINRLHEIYDQELSLDELAALCGLSKYHFARLFKRATGAAPIAYRNMLRLRHAQSLLEETELTVADVAAAVGYRDPAYFSAQFKAETGLSPRAYRRQYP